MHYSNEELKDLLSKKNTELKKIAQRLKINEETYNSTSNVSLRKTIEKIDDFDLTSISIDVTKEDAYLKILSNIFLYLRYFNLIEKVRIMTKK